MTEEKNKKSIKMITNNTSGREQTPVWRNASFWHITVLMAACSIFYYMDVFINWAGWVNLHWDIFYTVHDLHRALFLIPALYAAYKYGIKGIIVTGMISFIVFLPRALVVSPYPNPLLRVLIFLISMIIMGVLLSLLTNNITRRKELTQDLQNAKNELLHKKAEEALSKSEKLYRSLFDNMLNAFQYSKMIFDEGKPEDYIYLNVNRAFKSMTGLDDVIGRKVSEVLPGIQQSDKELFDILGRVALTGQPEQFEIYVNALKKWFSASAYSPAKEYFVVIFEDINERKRAEVELKKINRIYKLLSNINQTIVRVKDQQLLFNEACRIAVDDGGFLMAWIGLVNIDTNKVDVVASSGKTGEYLNDINIDLNNERYSSGPTGLAIKSGKSFFSNNIETDDKMIPWREKALKLGYRSSITVPIIVSVKTIGAYTMYAGETDFFNEDEIKLLNEMTSDISFALEFIGSEYERRRAEEEIHKLNEILEQRVITRTAQLEESNKELEAFTYSVSHDLRAPLRHINGYVELLIKRFREALPEKGLYYLDTIADSTRQMAALIDDLLQFSRTGRQEMRQENIDMNIVLQEVLESVKKDNAGRDIEWVITKLPNVYGDYAMLRLVWFNLLNNAAKFTRKNDNPKIEIGCREDGKEYVFFVRDNGVGFDMQYAHKLFGVFQRLHSSEEFEGTGIGLANVRRIITKHGGHTWAEAVPDKGAVFYFTLLKNKEKES